MSVDFLYTARFAIAEDMDREFLNGVHTLVDHLLGSVADDARSSGHRLRIDKTLARLSITLAIAAESFDEARERARPLVEDSVGRRGAPLDRWTFILHSDEVLDLRVDRSVPGWERLAAARDGFGFGFDDRPDDGLVWEVLDGVLCSKPLKTETEARIVSNVFRLLGGESPGPDPRADDHGDPLPPP